MSDRAARARAAEMLKMVGIPDPERRLKAFPHEISGGMAQRVMIAMALALEPELLIADEPTTALDVTIQAQILDLMRTLQRETGTSIILITHDLGVVAEMCDRVAVMYAGEIVEEADVGPLFHDPQHPYTQGLIGSIPVLGEVRESLAVIPGSVPNLLDPPKGCRFAPRCFAREEFGVSDRALAEHPRLLPVTAGVETDLGPARSRRGLRRRTPSGAGSTTMARDGRPAPRARCHPAARQRVVHEHAQGGLDSTAAGARASRRAPLVEVRGLVKHFPIKGGILSRQTAVVQAVDGVDFTIARGETLGLVGESGCGKTTVGRLLLRLHRPDRRHDPLRRPGHRPPRGLGARSPTGDGCS